MPLISSTIRGMMMKLFLTLLLFLVSFEGVYADQQSFEREKKSQIDSSVREILSKHCGEGCRLLGINLDTYEEIQARDDLGFEALNNTADSIEYFIRKATVSIQISDSISQANRERLSRIINLRLKKLNISSVVEWENVEFPNITESIDSSKELEFALRKKLNKSIQSVFDKYCPDTCIVEKIFIDGKAVVRSSLEKYEYPSVFFDQSRPNALKVSEISIDITMDENIKNTTRLQIERLLEAKTRFIEPIVFNVNVTSFPESYFAKEKREKLARDPYGLEKLRQMLILFRDLAGTKEIITSTNSLETRSNKEESSNTESLSQLLSSSEQSQSSKENTDTNSLNSESDMSLEELAPYLGAGAVFCLICLILILRYAKAKREANELMMLTPQNTMQQEGQKQKEPEQTQKPIYNSSEKVGDEFKIQVEIENLKTELMNVFVKNPKVAKETFGRLLKEDGVFETSKFVHIFGHLVVFELLAEPRYRRELDDLSEYYHRSSFEFSDKEIYELLQKLKVRVTASEIKVLARKSSEEFEFLSKLEPNKIYQLINDEKIQVQGIVMTQLDKKTRNDVFDLYPNNLRANLLSSLSFADAVPKEYLFNIAKTLQKKVESSSDFDTENLSSNDILLDLLEKSPLNDQKVMMKSLHKKSPDIARVIKSRLVTLDTLPFLKDGHLLEVVIGLDRDILLDFLSSTKDEIRELILYKAPAELVENWIEEIQMRGLVTEEKNRAAQIRVIERIRSLASNNIINILEINEMIFKDSTDPESEQITQNSSQNQSYVAA